MNTPNRSTRLKHLLLALAMSMALAVAYGCGKRGGGERAGEKVDDALHEAKNGPKDLFDKDGPAEKTGEKVDKALGHD